MRKIRLNLDVLAVDSFETGAPSSPAGTVHAQANDAAAAVAATTTSPASPCLPDTFPTCPRRHTIYASCVANCECTNGLHACLGPIQ